MKRFLAFLALSVSTVAIGGTTAYVQQNPCVYAGQYVKCLGANGMEVADGSAASPAYTFTSDPDNGFYRVGTNNPALAVGGVKLMSWTAGIMQQYIASSEADYILNRTSGTVASPSVITTGDVIGGIYFRGYSGSAYENAAAITALATGTVGTSAMPGIMVFKTTPASSTTAAERMRIDQAGLVDLSQGTSTGIKFPNGSTTLDRYEEGTFSVSLTGARTTGAMSWTYSRVGKSINVTVTNTADASCSAATFSGTAQIPSGYRPSSSLFFPIPVKDNGSNQASPGYLQITTGGNVTIGKSYASDNFTNAANCNWAIIGIAYTTN